MVTWTLYRAKRTDVEDATVHFLNHVSNHLETPSPYVHILFAAFSSALRTVQADLRPVELGLNHPSQGGQTMGLNHPSQGGQTMGLNHPSQGGQLPS